MKRQRGLYLTGSTQLWRDYEHRILLLWLNCHINNLQFHLASPAPVPDGILLR
jgi:hypothetical protein